MPMRRNAIVFVEANEGQSPFVAQSKKGNCSDSSALMTNLDDGKKLRKFELKE
jgi:hypothetical protein